MKCVIALLLGFLAVALGAPAPEGESLFSPLVVGGENVQHLEIPYTIRLRLSETLRSSEIYRYCGAARLNNRWFVTAAECLDSELYNRIEIAYPQGNKHGFNTKLMYFHDIDFTIHPNYNNITKENNIAVFNCIFCGTADQSEMPRLPKESEKDETFSGYKPIVSGWTINNATAESQEHDTIQAYETSMVNRFLCKLAYFFRSVTIEHICASTWGGKRLTESHTGVPLVVREGSEPDSRFKLIGIASSVRPWTTILPVPTVFTNIAQHAGWINETIENEIL